MIANPRAGRVLDMVQRVGTSMVLAIAHRPMDEEESININGGVLLLFILLERALQ